MWARTLMQHIGGLALTLLLGGLAAATLVRLAPGFGIDQREFDVRLSETSIQSIRASRAGEHHLFAFYASYLQGLVHGNFGISHSLGRPVAELVKQRGPVTVRLASTGLLGGWALGLGLAIAAARWKKSALDVLSVCACGLVLCLPAAVLGLLILFAGAPRWWAIALVVFPKIFSYSRSFLDRVSGAPHVLLAHAKGLGKSRIFLWHVMPVMLPETLALAGISVSLAFSAVIPLEAVCDIPGLGQLAWQAALGRDLPVLVTVTLLLALVTRVANAAADVAISALPRC